MEANVPEAERNRAGEVLVRILNGALFELAQMTREQAGLKPMAQDEKTLGFMSQMVLSLSDAHFYPAPMAFELKDFTQVQASVFQVARAPGKTIVYLGCALPDPGRVRHAVCARAPRLGLAGAARVLGASRGSRPGAFSARIGLKQPGHHGLVHQPQDHGWRQGVRDVENETVAGAFMNTSTINHTR